MPMALAAVVNEYRERNYLVRLGTVTRRIRTRTRDAYVEAKPSWRQRLRRGAPGSGSSPGVGDSNSP